MNNSEYKNRVFKIINNNNFFAKKKFSQNFLLDDNIIKNIVNSAEIDENTSVIEIGPGLGAVTKEILQVAKEVLVYEIDEDLIPVLKEFFDDYNNLTILNKDILKANIDGDIDEYFVNPKKIVLISNLPYHITTPIIMKVFEESLKINVMVLMMQYEVAKRISSKPNTKDYNALSIIIQHQSDVKYLFKVPKTVFNPKPNVDSAVIRMDRYTEVMNSKVDYSNFYKFVHNAFSQRRKTLINNFYSNYKEFSKEFFLNLLEKHHIDPKIRAESLSLEDFLSLYDDFININVEEK